MLVCMNQTSGKAWRFLSCRYRVMVGHLVMHRPLSFLPGVHEGPHSRALHFAGDAMFTSKDWRARLLAAT